MELMKKIYQSYAEIAFPPTCACCGTSTNSEERFICSLCRTERFENVFDERKDILPESVTFLNTMWYFDKGGYLQDLLHKLKYHHLRGVGLELGYLLGTHFLHRHSQDKLDRIYNMKPLIVPVPLHRSKKRKRGYNQARALGEGVAKSTGWDIIGPGFITRTKKTKTQTGLNLKQRSENLRGAFQIEDPEPLKDRLSVIVDDVFTTGATTFELAGTLQEVTGNRSGILTVARA